MTIKDELDRSHAIEMEIHNWKEAKQFLPTPAKIIGWCEDGNSLLIEDEKTGKVYLFHSVFEERKEVYENIKLVRTDVCRPKPEIQPEGRGKWPWPEYLKGVNTR